MSRLSQPDHTDNRGKRSTTNSINTKTKAAKQVNKILDRQRHRTEAKRLRRARTQTKREETKDEGLKDKESKEPKKRILIRTQKKEGAHKCRQQLIQY